MHSIFSLALSFADINEKICEQVPQCVGWSNTKRRIYTTSHVYIPGIEVFVLGGMPRSRAGIFAGLPIGGICGNTAYMGTISFFAQDSYGNYYAVTDAHVVYCYNTVYFPSPLLKYYPNYTAEKIPITNPVPIGTVVYRSDIASPHITLDMAVIKLNPGVQPYTITYGKFLPLFFDVPNEAEPVVKVGARTGVTSGMVIDQSATLKVYTIFNTEAYFTGPLFQIYSLEGDSGGPIFVGNSIVSTIVAGTGQFAVGNNVMDMISTLRSLGLKPYFSHNKKVLYVASIPPIVSGALLAALSFFMN